MANCRMCISPAKNIRGRDMMTTRATCGGVRVILEHYQSAWYWHSQHAMSQTNGRGFLTMADAIADAQRVHGADVCVVQHSEPEPGT